MNIAIVGSGSLACLLSTMLGYANNVVMIGRWQTQMDALASNGLTIVDPYGQRKTMVVAATSEPASIAAACDLALIAVKSANTAQAARDAEVVLSRDGLGITFQNGLGNLPILQKILGEQRATAAVTSQGAMLLGPGVVHHTGSGPTVLGLAPLLGDRQKSLVIALSKVIDAAGWECHIAENMDELIWAKLAVSAAINPLTSILDVPNGTLLDSSTTIAIMDAAAHEVVAVANAKGIALNPSEITARVRQVARETAGNSSSMLQDIRRGVATEINAISGAVVEQAKAVGLAVPVNRRLLEIVLQKEQGSGPGDSVAMLRQLASDTEDSQRTISGATG